MFNTHGSSVKLIIQDEVNCKFEGLSPSVRREMMSAVSYMVPNARHTPSFKLGRWNGKIEFMTMGGSTYIHMLDKLVPILDKYNIQIEIEDQRINQSFEFEPIDKDLFSYVEFPDGHHMQGKSIQLHDHQVNAVNALLSNQQGLLLACTSSGKAQPLSEKILTPYGWKLMGDIKVHDEILSPDGNISKVLGVYPQGIKEVVQIAFDDGRTARCCKEHLWKVTTNETYPEFEVLSTEEIIKSNKKYFIPTISGDKSLKGDEYYSSSYEKILKKQKSFFSVGRNYEIDFSDGEYRLFEMENHDILGISTIEEYSKEECQCIYVDHPEHLYICTDFIVTHNTLITAALAHQVQKYGRSIIIVPSTDLVQQTYNDFVMVGLEAGMFYANQKDFGKQHTITTWQSLNCLWKATKKGDIVLSEQDVHDFTDGVNTVIVDECHLASGEAIQGILGKLMYNVPLRFGMTGTIPKDETLAAKIKCQVGNVVFEIKAKELQEKGILSTCNINCYRMKSSKKYDDYQDELKYLTTDSERMKYISTIISAISESGNTLVLVDRLECGELLCDYLGIPRSEFIKGVTKKKDREASYGEIRWTDNKILIATFGVASTGISISRLYNVVMIEPGKSFVRTIQSIGRGLRKAEDKDHVEIFDISGMNKFSSRHHRERIAYYKEAEYPYTETKIDWEK